MMLDDACVWRDHDRAFVRLALGFIIYGYGFSQSVRCAVADKNCLPALVFRCHGWFPDDRVDFDTDVVAYVADQTGAPDDASYALSSDTARRQRGFILDFLRVRRATSRDRKKLQVWVFEHLGGRSPRLVDWIERGWRGP